MPQFESVMHDISNFLRENRQQQPEFCGLLDNLISAILDDNQEGETLQGARQVMLRTFDRNNANDLREARDDFSMVIQIAEETLEDMVAKVMADAEEKETRRRNQERDERLRKEKERHRARKKGIDLRAQRRAAMKAVTNRSRQIRKLEAELRRMGEEFKREKQLEKEARRKVNLHKSMNVELTDSDDDSDGSYEEEGINEAMPTTSSDNNLSSSEMSTDGSAEEISPFDSSSEDGSSAEEEPPANVELVLEEIPADVANVELVLEDTLVDAANIELVLEETPANTKDGESKPREFSANDEDNESEPQGNSIDTENAESGSQEASANAENPEELDEATMREETQDGIGNAVGMINSPAAAVNDVEAVNQEPLEREREQSEPILVNPEEEVGDEYWETLFELTSNKRNLIEALTSLARKEVKYAEVVVRVIEGRLREVEPRGMLPIMNLIDSILRNVGSPYNGLFQQNLVSTFGHVYRAVNEAVRKKLNKLRLSWENSRGYSIFERDVLNQVDTEVRSINSAQLEPKEAPKDPTVADSEASMTIESNDGQDTADTDANHVGGTGSQSEGADGPPSDNSKGHERNGGDDAEVRKRPPHGKCKGKCNGKSKGKCKGKGKRSKTYTMTQEEGKVFISDDSEGDLGNGSTRASSPEPHPENPQRNGEPSESSESNGGQDTPRPGSSGLNDQSEPIGEPAKKRKKPMRRKKGIAKKVAGRRRAYNTNTDEDRKQAVSAYIYVMKNPKKFVFGKKKRRKNEGASMVLRLLDLHKGRWKPGQKTKESTLRNWLSAYFKKYPKQKPKGTRLMKSTFKWTLGEVDLTPPDWIFRRDPAAEQAEAQAQAGVDAETSDDSPPKEKKPTSRRRGGSSAKRGERKRSRDSSAEDPSVKLKVRRPKRNSPISGEASNGSKEASPGAAQEAEDAGDDGKGEKSKFFHGLNLRNQIVTRRRSQEASSNQDSLPPILSPQKSKTYNKEPLRDEAPVLQRQGIEDGGEENNDGLKNQESGDNSANEIPGIGIQDSSRDWSRVVSPTIPGHVINIHFDKNYHSEKRRKRKAEMAAKKETAAAANLPPSPEPAKRRRQYSPVGESESPQDHGEDGQRALASTALSANAVAASSADRAGLTLTPRDNLGERESNESGNPDSPPSLQAGPSHSVAAMTERNGELYQVSVKLEAFQPEELKEFDFSFLNTRTEEIINGAAANPDDIEYTAQEILNEYTQVDLDVLNTYVRQGFGSTFPTDPDEANNLLANFWRNFPPDAGLPIMHRRALAKLIQKRQETLNEQPEGGANAEDDDQPPPEAQDDDGDQVKRLHAN